LVSIARTRRKREGRQIEAQSQGNQEGKEIEATGGKGEF
jgi:hypothetical protein